MSLKNIVKRFSILLSKVNSIIPKKENRIVLYSNIGFRDNVEALYRYLIKEEYKYNRNYSIICSTDEWKKYCKLKKIKNVKFVSCYIGVYYFFTSKYFFYCFGKYPIIPTKKQCVVNLWHGMPLKKIGALVESEAKNKQNYFTYVLSTSEFFKDYMQKAFQCRKEQVIICGQPRNDDLFDENIDLKEIFKLSNTCKLICYMPTFRKSNKIGLNDYSDDDCLYEELKKNKNLILINKILVQYNVFIFIKPHPMDDFDKILIDNLTNIIFVDESILKRNKLNTYKFLGKIDALITDYSSVYFDFLLIDKPIGFIVDDIKNYNDKRGFIIESPLTIMPGEKITTINELFDFIFNVSLGIDNYKEDRKRINNLVNYYKNGKNTKKILDIVGITNERIKK